MRAVVCFSFPTPRETEKFGYRVCYLAICFALRFLPSYSANVLGLLRITISLMIGYIGLLGTAVHHSCRTVWCQLRERPGPDIELQVPHE